MWAVTLLNSGDDHVMAAETFDLLLLMKLSEGMALSTWMGRVRPMREGCHLQLCQGPRPSQVPLFALALSACSPSLFRRSYAWSLGLHAQHACVVYLRQHGPALFFFVWSVAENKLHACVSREGKMGSCAGLTCMAHIRGRWDDMGCI